MSSKWYNPITTRTKITIVFVVLVSLVLFIMSQILFSVAEKVWKSKKMQIMQASMASMTMESDLKSKFPNYRVLQDDGSVKEQQGIFTQ